MAYGAAACTAVGILFPVLGLLTLIARTRCQWAASRPWDVDNLLIIPAFFLVLAGGVGFIYGAQAGIIGGIETSLVGEEYVKLNKFEYAFWAGHFVTVCLIKLSILFFLRRIFGGHGTRTAFDIANWSLIIFVPIWTVTFLVGDLAACGSTPQAAWDDTRFWSSSTCINSFAFNLVACVFNFLVDLAILIEPLVMISTLHLVTARQRVQASAVFLLSILAVVAALLRMVTWAQINAGGHTAEYYNMLGTVYPVTDLEGIITPVLFWTYIEMGVGFLVACLLPSARIVDIFASSKFGRLLSSVSQRSFQASQATATERSRSHTSHSQTSFSYRSKNSLQASSDADEREKNADHWDVEMAVIDRLQ